MPLQTWSTIRRVRGKWPARLLICLAALVLPLGCTSGKPADSESVRPAAEPVARTVQIPPLFVDDTPELQYDFPVWNETGQPVRFTQVRPSCACAGGTKLAAMELAPGEETTLHFDIDLRQRKGPQQFVCHLVEAGGSTWTYTLETTLYERARFVEIGSIPFRHGRSEG